MSAWRGRGGVRGGGAQLPHFRSPHPAYQRVLLAEQEGSAGALRLQQLVQPQQPGLDARHELRILLRLLVLLGPIRPPSA